MKNSNCYEKWGELGMLSCYITGEELGTPSLSDLLGYIKVEGAKDGLKDIFRYYYLRLKVIFLRKEKKCVKD